VTLVPVPTKTARSHSDIKGRRPFDVPASIFNFHVNFLQWVVANPRTTKPFSNNLFTFLFARFSQSDLLLTPSDGTVASSKDVEGIHLHCSHA